MRSAAPTLINSLPLTFSRAPIPSPVCGARWGASSFVRSSHRPVPKVAGDYPLARGIFAHSHIWLTGAGESAGPGASGGAGAPPPAGGSGGSDDGIRGRALGLIEDMRSGDRARASRAARMLGQLGPVIPEVLPALRGALAHRDHVVVNAAAEALGEIGPPALDAFHDLMALMRTDGDSSSVVAAAAIARMDPPPSLALRPLIAALRSRPSIVRRLAGEVLAVVGAAAVPSVIGVMGHPNPLVRETTAYALGQFGPVTPEVVPALARALADRDEEVREAAARALWEIGSASYPAVSELIEAVFDERHHVAWTAIHALGAIGSAAIDALPALRSVAYDEGNKDRLSDIAKRAIENIELKRSFR